MQDPTRLDRQAVVLVDALASGIFGSEVRNHCAKRIEGWIDELSQRAGFLDEQRKQWNEALRSKIPTTNNAARYNYLSQYSPTWPSMNETLNGAAMQAVVRDHFKAIFEGPIPPSPNLMAAVDDLLDKLVQNFDDEELPLRRDERLCQLIIEEAGNRSAAKSRYDLESKALDETVSFTQLLTNAAMHPETSHASRATQRLAIALSRSWIKDAHQDLTASIRAAVPIGVDLIIEDWQGTTQNGENEKELAASLGAHIDRRRDKALAKIKLDFQHWAALVIGVGLILSAISGGVLPLAIGTGCLIWFFMALSKVAKAKAKIADDFSKLREQSLQVLSAACAEVVEWRRDFTKRDAVSTEVVQLLDAISPEQYVLSTYDNARQVMAKPAA